MVNENWSHLKKWRLWIVILFCHTWRCYPLNLKEDVKIFLDQYNKEIAEYTREDTLAWWKYETDMTKENKKATLVISGKVAKYMQEVRHNASKFDESSDELSDSLRRQLKFLKKSAAPKSVKSSKEISKTVSKMTFLYSQTKTTRKLKDGKIFKLQLNKHIIPLMIDLSEKNLPNLVWLWRDWRNKVGPLVKPEFEKYVELVNEGAVDNKLHDFGEFWRDSYEIGANNLKFVISNIWKQVQPLYEEFHAYVRFKLNEKFGDDKVPKDGLMPVHFLGMWGEHWNHLYDHILPYPEKKIPDVTEKMKSENYTPEKVIKLAESFFESIGLESMPQSFWDKSVISKEQGKKTVCHPSSWDLGDGDVRFKMPCMGVSQSDLMTVHHEMGHIEYYLLYKDKPYEFRTGANPGFHEAVGDTIALSVMVPHHLKEIGLIEDLDEDEETDINYLIKEALHKIAFLPFGYAVDLWRWSVFSGETKPSEYNEYWWKLRATLQGVKPPMERTEKEFDPGCFFHVAHNTEYLRYLFSYILQYQFHKALCKEANQSGELYKCSIYKSKDAGKRLRLMLELGKERPWTDALALLTGEHQLSPVALLDFFKPLQKWLSKHRKKHNYKLGWELDGKNTTTKYSNTHNIVQD